MQPSGLSAKDLTVYNQSLERMNQEQSVRYLSTLTEKCFNDCVLSFRTQNLSDQENNCLEKCSKKFILASRQIVEKFSDEMTQS